MSLFSKTRLLQTAAIAAVVVAFSTADAYAWGHKRGGYGSYGGYGSAGSAASYGGYGSYGSYGYSASYGGSYGSYGSYGGSGSSGKTGLFARWHARKAARKSASYGSYGSSGSYGGSYAVSYGGSSGSYGGYGGSYGGHGSSGSYGGTSYYGGGYDDGVIYESAPATEMAPADGAGPPPTPQPGIEGAAPPLEPSASATEAEIFVSLPEEAKVFVNDRPTTSVGAERHYISRGLQGGRAYSYKLRVEFERDGQPVVEDKLVRLQAGQTVKLAFGSEEPAQQTAATELKLRVPANAKVTLAGAPTQQTGEVRTYASTLLKPGQNWDGYVVRVELEQDGKTLVEERTLDIEGGKSYELAFEMKGEATQIAAK